MFLIQRFLRLSDGSVDERPAEVNGQAIIIMCMQFPHFGHSDKGWWIMKQKYLEHIYKRWMLHFLIQQKHSFHLQLFMPVSGCGVWFLMCVPSCTLGRQRLALRMFRGLLFLSAPCIFPLSYALCLFVLNLQLAFLIDECQLCHSLGFCYHYW